MISAVLAGREVEDAPETSWKSMCLVLDVNLIFLSMDCDNFWCPPNSWTHKQMEKCLCRSYVP